MKKFYVLLIFSVFCAPHFYANYMLIQNVTTVNDNPINKTIQVQFDISWQNSWRDAINWDAAWLFVKYKDGAGNWGHAHLNTTGFNNGSGTSNTLEVTNDNVGAFLYRSGLGSGSFTSTGMQLQWNYGQNGLINVSGLEIQVFGIEQVYIPEGEFNIFSHLNYMYSYQGQNAVILCAPALNDPVINMRLSPVLTYQNNQHSSYKDTIRIKGDVGIDTDNDGVVDNTNYPTGFYPFYVFKYELTEQQYADFYNTLSQSQQALAQYNSDKCYITNINGKYVSSRPNNAYEAFSNSNFELLTYADWSGLRPMSYLEYQKSIWGNEKIVKKLWSGELGVGIYWHGAILASNDLYPLDLYDESNFHSHVSNFTEWNGEEISTDISNIWAFNNPYAYGLTPTRSGMFATATSTRFDSQSSFYGVMDYSGNLYEPFANLHFYEFNDINGDGVLENQLNDDGFSNVSLWSDGNNIISYGDIRQTHYNNIEGDIVKGIRLSRSAP